RASTDVTSSRCPYTPLFRSIRGTRSCPDPDIPVTATAAKQNLLDLDREGLEHFFADTLGEKRIRAHQVMKWIHHRHVTDFEEMTDRKSTRLNSSHVKISYAV